MATCVMSSMAAKIFSSVALKKQLSLHSPFVTIALGYLRGMPAISQLPSNREIDIPTWIWLIEFFNLHPDVSV